MHGGGLEGRLFPVNAGSVYRGLPKSYATPLNQHHSGEGTIGDHALPRSLYTRWQLATPLRSAMRLVPGRTRTAGHRA